MLANDNKEESKLLEYMNFTSTFHILKTLRIFCSLYASLKNYESRLSMSLLWNLFWNNPNLFTK